MNYRIVDGLFGCLVFTLPFIYIPFDLWQILLGGPYGTNLVVYPLLAGFIYTLYCQLRYRNVLVYREKVGKFLLVYLFVLLVSLVHGVFIYPYFDQILNGPINQIPRLVSFMGVLREWGIDIDEKSLLQLWLPIRFFKSILMEVLYSFGAAYMVFCWYHNRAQRAWKILLRGVIVSLILIAAYGMVDVFYQAGNMTAQNILVAVNPLLHSIYDSADWHPRLLWGGQIRSIFVEPSHLGMYMAFAMPLLWWKLFQEKGVERFFCLILGLVLTFELFLTQSRTVFATQIGEWVLVLLYSIYRRDKKYFVLLLIITVTGGIAFGGSLYFIRYQQVPFKYFAEEYPLADRYKEMQESDLKKRIVHMEADDYVDETLLSLSGQNTEGLHAASNHSRFALMKNDFLIGKEHLFLGVGFSLRSAYIRDKLDTFPGAEIQKWNKKFDKLGVLRAGYPLLDDYLIRFAETGILGLGLFLFPVIYILIQCARIFFWRKYSVQQTAPILFSSISLIGFGTTGVGNSLNQMWCGWLMLGLLYLLYNEIDSSKKEDKICKLEN